MRTTELGLLLTLTLGASWACGEGVSTPDAGQPTDAAPQADASGPADAASADTGAADTGAADAGAADAAPGPAYLTTLTSTEAFVSLSRAMGVKYILRVSGATPRAPLLETCYFQNTARYQFHIEFLRTFPELSALSFQDYEDLVLDPATRIWWGGAVLRVPQQHPISGTPVSLGYQIYATNGAVVGLREADIVEVDALLRACIPYAANQLAFLPGDPLQQAFARTVAASLAARGVAVLLR
jgi:hypothetical protein